MQYSIILLDFEHLRTSESPASSTTFLTITSNPTLPVITNVHTPHAQPFLSQLCRSNNTRRPEQFLTDRSSRTPRSLRTFSLSESKCQFSYWNSESIIIPLSCSQTGKIILYFAVFKSRHNIRSPGAQFAMLFEGHRCRPHILIIGGPISFLHRWKAQLSKWVPRENRMLKGAWLPQVEGFHTLQIIVDFVGMIVDRAEFTDNNDCDSDENDSY